MIDSIDLGIERWVMEAKTEKESDYFDITEGLRSITERSELHVAAT
jgi:hypothetical protein